MPANALSTYLKVNFKNKSYLTFLHAMRLSMYDSDLAPKNWTSYNVRKKKK